MILVFGRTGQVATELGRQAPGATFLGREQADLTDPGACAAAIRERAPEVVINAAAWTAVDKAEEDEATARLVNAEAPGAMARACAEAAIPFLHVSTDYVFDGSGERPWTEDDPVAPLGAYGRTKLAGEEAVRAVGGQHLILRTSWVFSAHGTNFVKTMLRLSETRDALTVVDDQIGGPTPAADIAATLLALAERLRQGAPGGTYHYGGQPHVSWQRFACETFRRAGRRVEVTGIPSADYPTPAARPLNSRMDGAKLMRDHGIAPPDWRAGLDAVLAELGAA
ncbi:dTDP-4-dehydrorhamnose reductase [Jannaschia formosa]|uniref:dTDP-4-dehydrorhamnose reductase n=1 Tax=Jannaschia formosa TaxID=2259592 RepID=UPI000E1BB835|nr:dTDP-4-dehydrorhamnose reductase [Jannaschia formosa]TFL17097.1 dTDP-4-dehydrorhamnose reductase [Jannaschia formosa]